MNAREQRIEALIAPTIADLGCECWGIELFSQGKRTLLRVYIDKPGDDGVTVDDCADVSREIGDLLDVEDVFGSAFTLEVSSPGMDCTLFKPEHYLANVGQQVEVRLSVPVEGRKRVTGLLAGLEDDEVIVRLVENGEQPDEEYVLPLNNVQRAKVIPQFGDKKPK